MSSELAALSLQGPNSRVILKELVSGIDFDRLNYFWLDHGQVENFPLTVTRTGYTGDLGYELWVRPAVCRVVMGLPDRERDLVMAFCLREWSPWT